jgi:hypothetical protein
LFIAFDKSTSRPTIDFRNLIIEDCKVVFIDGDRDDDGDSELELVRWLMINVRHGKRFAWDSWPKDSIWWSRVIIWERNGFDCQSQISGAFECLFLRVWSLQTVICFGFRGE